MTDEVSRDSARDPQDLERLLVSRQRTGDVDGMAALYEPHAVLDCGGAGFDCDGQVLVLKDLLGLTFKQPAKFVRQYFNGTSDIGSILARSRRTWSPGHTRRTLSHITSRRISNLSFPRYLSGLGIQSNQPGHNISVT